ncbi:hypothetical protein ZHAS_00021602 [Anopheles sinensis]|uniref:Uncharacterized protein n=1 Tax=Anopheles sinensis TaxID=74873 RepID=A0A084WSV3_ANOSI|nr:hypothetical protein ZHAS_00021602 [Anopheles sinensis]
MEPISTRHIRFLSFQLMLMTASWLLGACHAAPFKGTRTYNLESDADRYGRYERVLLGLRTSEGLRLDPALLEEVRQVLLDEERSESAGSVERYRTVDVHLGNPQQSRHVAELLYRVRLQARAGHNRTE